MLRVVILYLLTILTVMNAGNIESEIGINIGLDSTRNENGNKFENPSFGLMYQDNKYIVSPRVDLEYVNVTNDQANALVKASVNGVYEYENKTNTTPYALAGVGYEYVSGGTDGVFESHPFVQGGAGVRVDLQKGFKARVEGKVLQIIGGNNEGNEFMLTAGISMPLSQSKKRVVPIRAISRRVIKPFPVKKKVVVINNYNNECPIKINAPDVDRDGVPNQIDQCPSTPCNFTVDNYGCPIKTTLKINFATNSANIEPASLFKVYDFANFLLKNKGSIVNIVGHTDSVGSATHNMNLSQRRANVVVSLLIRRGISPRRLQAFGRGESQPLTTNKTKIGRAMNRRIEAELVYPRGRM